MNNFRDGPHLPVADAKILSQGFKAAVVSAMSEARVVEHVERNGLFRNLVLGSEYKPRIWIDKPPDQPRGCTAIYSGTRPGHPDTALEFVRVDFPGKRHRFACASRIRVGEQFGYSLLQWASEEIDIRNFLETATQTRKPADTLSVFRRRDVLLNFFHQFLVFPGPRLRETPDQLWRRKVINRMDMYDRGIASVLANGGSEPLEPFFIGGGVRQQVARVAEGHSAVSLKLPPNLDSLACAVSGQGECQQQPGKCPLFRTVISIQCYDHNS